MQHLPKQALFLGRALKEWDLSWTPYPPIASLKSVLEYQFTAGTAVRIPLRERRTSRSPLPPNHPDQG
jgi:hypothetical protein